MQCSQFLVFVLLMLQPSVGSRPHIDGGATDMGDDDMPVSVLQRQLDIDTHYGTHSENNTENGSWGAPPVLSCSLSPFDLDLARIADAVCDPLGSPLAQVPGWELDSASAAQITSGGGSDNVRIYKNYANCQDTNTGACFWTSVNGQCASSTARTQCARSCGYCQPTCALAISGSNDLTDWFNSANVLETAGGDACGFDGIHNGFWTETRTILTHGSWPVLASTMSNCAEKYVTGFSLGGAVASILAYCANRGALSQYGSSFSINQLYTFGAPAVSHPALTSNGGSCFAGKRFYIVDGWTYDPVPPSATSVGYRHPKMQAEQISRTSVLSSSSSSCGSARTEEIPDDLGVRIPWTGDHSMTRHIERIQQLSCSGY